ncbi:rhomboid family intramembrane serine protease [Candidatus Woesearchaeota archaeon]|nr:rhomboid family intramembrane serine protease [Candidatus Woesearchaeota archaeon]
MRYRPRSAVMPIIVANIAVFILQLLLGRYGFNDLFILKMGDALVRPWTLLTSIFMHAGLTHLLFNMYVLFIFGPLLEQRIGSKRFLWIYFGSGLIASFISSFIYDAALGASGAVMGMIGVVIILIPNLRVLFFFIIPMPFWIAGIIIAAIDIMGVFVPSGIANIAHLVGMGCGVGYGLYLKRKKKRFHRKFSSKNHMSEDDIKEYIRSGRI